MTPEIYHGTPITPQDVWPELFGRDFCVSFFRPDDIYRADVCGYRLMLDNGAFSYWMAARKQGREADESDRQWAKYYEWVEKWLGKRRWAVVPDAVAMPSQINDALINEWPHGKRCAAPVYHMDEPISRLGRLLEQDWNRVCLGWVGSTQAENRVGSKAYLQRLDEIDFEIKNMPWEKTHMLRGIAVSRLRPFQKCGQHKFSAEWAFA